MRENITENSSLLAAELLHVTKYYRRRHLGRLTVTRGVEDISLDVKKGEIYGLLGLNGAGKTTAIKLLLGLLFPIQGEARLFHVALPNREVMRRIGYLPELPTLYRYLTIGELLTLYGKLSEVPSNHLKVRIGEVVQEIGLGPHQKKHLREYSKGMLQRAGLAQALLHDPDLFILDEPVSGLDPLGLIEMRNLLQRLNSQGKTIFFSSHIISEAEKLCHRVGILHEGRLVRVLERKEWDGKRDDWKNYSWKLSMGKIWGVARYTFTEIFRNKVYYVLLLFAAVMLGATLLLSELGGEQKNRMIMDFGLMSIEAFSLLVAVFAAVTLVLEEMESKTLYLMLSRPVARYQFVLGRYFGLMLLLSVTYAMMAGGHFALLRLQNVPVDRMYYLSLLFSWEKIVVIAAIGMAFSLFATSTLSAVAFTFFFWGLGHFSSEMRFLAQKSSQPVMRVLLDIFYYLAPNFQLMNLRDLPSAGHAGTGWIWSAAGYGLCYTAACLAIVILLFRKKEF